jgi:hypothetical protein
MRPKLLLPAIIWASDAVYCWLAIENSSKILLPAMGIHLKEKVLGFLSRLRAAPSDCWVQSKIQYFDCTQQSTAPYGEMIAGCNQIPPNLIAGSNQVFVCKKKRWVFFQR